MPCRPQSPQPSSPSGSNASDLCRPLGNSADAARRAGIPEPQRPLRPARHQVQPAGRVPHKRNRRDPAAAGSSGRTHIQTQGRQQVLHCPALRWRGCTQPQTLASTPVSVAMQGRPHRLLPSIEQHQGVVGRVGEQPAREAPVRDVSCVPARGRHAVTWVMAPQHSSGRAMPQPAALSNSIGTQRTSWARAAAGRPPPW